MAQSEPRLSDAELDNIADQLILCSWSASYNRQSTSHLCRFVRICSAHNWQILPITELTMTRYAAYRYASTTNVGSSFRTELYGIRQGLLRFGIRLDITVNGPMPRLSRMVQAWCRIRNHKLIRKPITSNILARFFAHLDPRVHDEQVTRAILAVAKFGMMRVSEYTYGPGGNNPKVGDLRLYPDAKDTQFMALYFSKSKCNQSARTERVICMCCCPEPCPVHEVANMLNSRPSVHPMDDLFCFENGARPGPKTINGIIKSLCELCGLDPSEYMSHCLRAGGICDALCAGVPDSICQLLSRHASLESLRPYKKLGDESLGTILAHHMMASRKKSGPKKSKPRFDKPNTLPTH